MKSAADADGTALAGVTVRKPDGRKLLYIAYSHVPVWKVGLRRRVRDAFNNIIADTQPVDKVFVECTDHPNPKKRLRREL
jgi:hypothetical protein